MKTYHVNEIFYSIQGEGIRAGIPHVFVRFAQCNLTCNEAEHGFDCDTEFTSGEKMTAEEIFREVHQHGCHNVLFTGGEPMLQVDKDLMERFFVDGYYIAIETNGTKEIPSWDLCVTTRQVWVSVSPKSAEHTLKVTYCDEVRYVRREGQSIPRPTNHALRVCTNKLISPAVPAGFNQPTQATLDWCVQLVKDNPEWRLSVQAHKFLAIR